MSDTKHIRNFCIIAHIDHGKSTLADRLIEMTHTVEKRDMKGQLLDSMDLERERGITIKMQAIRMTYQPKPTDTPITMNLIDTPGHVDFSYEVSRSLAACEGALLLVDATQGIEAQTLANFYLALDHDLDIIPVINKIDLPSANVEKVAQDIEQVLGIDAADCLPCSAKTGEGVDAILAAIANRISPPKPSESDALRALIYDAHYDAYRGVITYVRIIDGNLKPGDKIICMATQTTYDALEIGAFQPKMVKRDQLNTGEVGYLIANIKTISDAQIGDTITHVKTQKDVTPLKGYAKAKPMVFCGFYPVDTADYPLLKDALDKLKLNDSALQFEPESSQALGHGYRCGFLGLLHMDIISERLSREFNIDIVSTAPNVTYRLTLNSGESYAFENPSDYPDPQKIALTEEPFMGLTVMVPNTYLGAVMTLCQEHRAHYKKAEYLDAERQLLTFSIPLNELITSFFDQLKSRTRGYASMDYWFEDYQPAKLVKVDVLINKEPVDALSFICHRDKARGVSLKLTKKLKELIPRQLYEVAIQAAVGGKVLCRETISAMRKNVTEKCYGGDISRKRKLIERQKEGKKKMKSIGSISVPKEAFMAVLKIDN